VSTAASHEYANPLSFNFINITGSNRFQRRTVRVPFEKSGSDHAGYDPLADEGIAYARKLEDNGVRVTLVHMSDQMHGFLTGPRHTGLGFCA
jgi:hypothetical protein